MQFKAYPSYNKCEDEVLDKLPNNWIIKPFWALFEKSEITNQINHQLLSVYLDKGVILYSEGGGLVHKPADSLEKYQLVNVNDFVMNNQQAWRGSIGVSPYRGLVSPAYLVFKIHEILNPNFVKYLVRDKYIIDKFMVSSLSVGTIQRQVKSHLLRKILIPIPLKEEQTKIAQYLDRETAKINALIAAQEKLINLLEEQRKSTISHAVTKGLNPNAPMKDSGIEWLGEVPAHWEVKPIKSLYGRIKRTGYEQETLLSVYREYGVIIKSSRTDNHNQESDDLSPYQLVNIGDLVINKMKAWQGSLAISRYRGIVSPAYYIYKFISKFEVNDNFIHNQIRSEYFIQSYKNFSKGIRVGQWDLENELFMRINLFVPPLNEQNEIVNFLDKENARIEALKEKQKELIEKLKEYRASVISHAVTGKIDVRDMVH
ncbi:restriction endonuclease subunit S [Bartonella sp. HY761]|uniref:restriction endonuclease subunit S n=1 Tax=Bartonella sp. HY761 TaxID=2979330 RepID=UPI0021FAFA69|nr:restriction endonuclease subunit S [Bartonella sp. HY761]UXN05407.1 restriction endonuclease subunit S [Bartonella sp. HY761]